MTGTPVAERRRAERRAEADVRDRPAERGGVRRAWWTETGLYLVAAVLTSALTAVVLRLRLADLAVPFYYVGDAMPVGAHFKTVLETGWYESQPALGAPAGQDYHDYPTADNLHMVAARLLGLLTDDWAVAMNAYYLLGFVLAALTMVWFLRLVGVSGLMTVTLSVLFALAPYHFQRNEGHLWLASYYVVPLALGVVVTAGRGLPLWRWRRGKGVPRQGLAALVTVVAMVLVGSASTYYAVFTAVLLAAAGLIALVRARDLRRFLGAAAAGLVLVGTVLANMAPDLWAQRGRDENLLALTRVAGEAEIYALKLSQLVLPSEVHRVETLRQLRVTYNETFPLPGESTSLGLVAAAGFVALLVILVLRAVRRSPVEGAAEPTGSVLTVLAVLAFVAFLAATVGGLSSLVALFVTDSLRGWGRMTIVIACLALAAVGLLVDAGVRRLSRRTAPLLRGALGVVAAVGVLGVGLYDQTTPAGVPEYELTSAAWTSDRAYVEQIEELLPAGSMVFQQPHIPFPESPPVNGVPDQDSLRMYLHSTDLRWSAGGIRGRPDVDWAGHVSGRPVDDLVAQVALAGFAGLHVDRDAYPDAGAALERELETRLGTGPAEVSADDRYSFWPLDGVLGELEERHTADELASVREALLLPVVAYLKPDLADPRAVGGGAVAWPSVTESPGIFIDNPRDVPLEVPVSFGVSSPNGAPEIEVELPGVAARRLDISEGPQQVTETLVLPPGRSVIRLGLPEDLQSLPEPWRTRFDVLDFTVTDPVVDAFQP